MNDPQLVEVYRCTNRMEGEIVRSKIAASGIAAFLQGDDAVSSFALGGAPTNSTLVRVFVATADRDRAQRLLLEHIEEKDVNARDVN